MKSFQKFSTGLLIVLLLPLASSAQQVTVTYNTVGSGYSFAIPCNATAVKAEAWGGGGGGGGAYYGGIGGNSSRAGGGGGGAYAVKNYGNGGATMSISVGNGGTGGTSNLTAGTGGDVNDGTAGGASGCLYNSASLNANGGQGGGHSNYGWTGHGVVQPGAGGAGGTAVGGDSGSCTGTSGGSGDNGGYGGGGCMGGGNTGNMSDGNDGVNGNAVGGGGAGGRTSKPFFGGNQRGGNGAAGRLVLTFNLPVITITSNNPNYCLGSELSVVNPCADATYTWRKNGTAVATGNSYTPTEVATYTVVATIDYNYSGGNPAISGNTTNPSNAITLKPLPELNAISESICNFSSYSVTFVDGIHGTIPTGASSYSWTVLSSDNIIGGTSGSGSTFATDILVHNQNNQETIVYEITPTTAGCTGSPFNITLILNPPTIITNDELLVCEADFPVVMGNLTLPIGTVSGTYYAHYKTVIYCDSMVVIDLTVPQTLFTDLDTTCFGQIYSWRDQTYQNLSLGSHVFYDTLTSSHGCDSVRSVVVWVNNTDETYVFDEVCFGTTYTNNGFNLLADKTFMMLDTLIFPNQFGCDSTLYLALTVRPNYNFTTEATIYGDQIYSWRGNEYQNLAEGEHIFYDSLTTEFGCDSVYKLTLTARSKYETWISDITCFGVIYDQHGFNVLPVALGQYLDTLTLTAVYACDSIIYLDLWINPTDTIEIFDEICQGETYNQNGFSILAAEATIVQETLNLNNQFGCDSVVNLHLTVHPVYESFVDAAICLGESFTQYGLDTLPQITGEHLLIANYQNINGCDSTINVRLMVHPTYELTFADTICQGNGYNRYGFDYAQTIFDQMGDFQFIRYLQTAVGCDSIRTLNLHVNPVYTNFYDTISICAADIPLRTGNRILFSSNTYLVNYLSACGCDSIVWLTLKVQHVPETREIFDFACQNSLYQRYGFTMNTDNIGTFTEIGVTPVGLCDSITILHLTVVDHYDISIADAACAGSAYQQYDFDLPADSTLVPGYKEFTRTLTSSDGCDSTITLQLTINPIYAQVINASICLGTIYHENGFETTPLSVGVSELHQNLTTINGCDSTITLFLTVNPHYESTSNVTICSNEVPYLWHNQNYALPGIYYDSLQTSSGCDSVSVLNLTINNAFYDTTFVSLCNEDHYGWMGQIYNQSGMYNQSYTTITGCDSIYTLVLQFHEAYASQEQASTCDNVPYWWHGQAYTQTGTYTYTTQSMYGCDSICILKLAVYPTYHSEEEAYSCNGTTYTWHGQLLSVSGIYYDTVHTVGTCDSMYQLTLHVYPQKMSTSEVVICAGGEYLWNGTVYTQSGIYSVVYHDGFCDSIATLHLVVNPLIHTELSAIICQGSLYEGYGFYLNEETTATPGIYILQDTFPTSTCDSIVTLTLTVTTASEISLTDTTYRGQPYFNHGFNISVFETQIVGEYLHQLVLQSVGGCDSIINLTLVVVSGTGIEEYPFDEIQLYPNPTQGKVTISCQSSIKSIAICDIYGRLVRRIEANAPEITFSVEEIANGHYVAAIETERGVIRRKLVKQ